MNWDQLTNGQKHRYSEGCLDYLNNKTVLPLDYLDENNSFYWMGYRDAEQFVFDCPNQNTMTNVQIFNHCN